MVCSNNIEGEYMTNHAIKEQISNNTLYVEIDPQPEWVNLMNFSHYSLPKRSAESDNWIGASRNDDETFQERTPPISIGDTVYQGEEWGFQNWWPSEPAYKLWKNIPHSKRKWHGYNKQAIETMPIKLADKTYKVVGIEVELMFSAEPRTEQVYSDYVKVEKWHWTYKLEVIK